MYIVRSLAFKNGVAHMAHIEHSLPRDDYKHGIDFMLELGGAVYMLDQKMLAPSDYQLKFQKNLLTKAQDKAAEAGGRVFRVDSDILRDAYRDAVEGKLSSRNITKFLEQLGAVVDVTLLMPKRVVKDRVSVPSGKIAIETVVADVGLLVKMGLLSEKDRLAGNVSAILPAQKQLRPAVEALAKAKQLKDAREIRHSVELQEGVLDILTRP